MMIYALNICRKLSLSLTMTHQRPFKMCFASFDDFKKHYLLVGETLAFDMA